MVVRRLAAVALLSFLSSAAATIIHPASDEPEPRHAEAASFTDAPTFDKALQRWARADDINAWIGARFEYDPARAIRLSETQRLRAGSVPIHAPHAFFDSPKGICVDLARFAVEALRVVEPGVQARYLMIEFAPVTMDGETLRRHWVATFTRDGGHFVFADSKRPGHLAGPYATLNDFVSDYARYRQRAIVAFRVLDTFERRARSGAQRQPRKAS